MSEAALRPEQERALAYARRRGTEAPLAEIRSRVAATFAEIERIVAPLAPEVARTRPAPGAWCVHEVVDHLVVSDGLAHDQLVALLREEPATTAVPASLQSPQPLAADWPTLLVRFHQVHRQILDALEGASDATPLTATAAVEMVVKCTGADGAVEAVHWLHHLDWKAFAILLHAHDREHIAQILRTLDAVAPGNGAAKVPAAAEGTEG